MLCEIKSMKVKKIFSIVLLFFYFSSTGLPQPEGKTTFSPGLVVNSKAPEFKLPDSENQLKELNEFVEQADADWTAILFYRSADWCPFCKKQLIELQKSSKKLKSKKIRVIGISSDDTAVLQKFSRSRKILFPLLSDKKGEVMDKYGIRNYEAKSILPYPGFFIIDKNGIIKGKLFYESYKKRYTSSEIIKFIESAKP